MSTRFHNETALPFAVRNFNLKGLTKYEYTDCACIHVHFSSLLLWSCSTLGCVFKAKPTGTTEAGYLQTGWPSCSSKWLCQTKEWNWKHCLQPGNTAHWPHVSLVHPLLTEGRPLPLHQLSNTGTTTISILRPLYRTTCISRHPQLTSGGLRLSSWSKVLLLACPCRWQLAHSDQGEDARVLLNGVVCTVSDTSTQWQDDTCQNVRTTPEISKGHVGGILWSNQVTEVIRRRLLELL